ncbi:MAG: Arc family DNA-binding protein [Candidatus Latescibacteria bacterium]|nr:Arc family DNA-binding protein [Candidatus Latescibacterota bacterium]
MSGRKSFLVRLPEELLEELNRWARDDLRSLNGQIEYLLREAVRKRRGVTLPDSAPPEGPVKPA